MDEDFCRRSAEREAENERRAAGKSMRILPQDRNKPADTNRLHDYLNDVERWISHAKSSAKAGEVNMIAMRKAHDANLAAMDYAMLCLEREG